MLRDDSAKFFDLKKSLFHENRSKTQAPSSLNILTCALDLAISEIEANLFPPAPGDGSNWLHVNIASCYTKLIDLFDQPLVSDTAGVCH